MSLTMAVPASVPSVRQSSAPCAPSSARKKTSSPSLAKPRNSSGSDPPGPGLMSLSIVAVRADTATGHSASRESEQTSTAANPTAPLPPSKGMRLSAAVWLLQRLLDPARLEELEDVAHLHVLVALEDDAALEALLDLLHVVLEAPQRSHAAGPDDGAV